MVLIAKTEPGSAGGVEWTEGGDKGAQDVNPRFADELLKISYDEFYVVGTKPKNTEAEAKAAAKVARGEAEALIKAEAKAAKDAAKIAKEDEHIAEVKAAKAKAEADEKARAEADERQKLLDTPLNLEDNDLGAALKVANSTENNKKEE